MPKHEFISKTRLNEDFSYKVFLNQCKSLREKYNISQREVAETYKVSQSLVALFETNKITSPWLMWAYINMMGGDLRWLKKE